MAAKVPGLAWESACVQGRPINYVTGGDGHPVVFLHGWALSHRSYRAALGRLQRAGAAVYAPSLPGFGGTPPLRPDALSLEGYGRWVADFIVAAGITGPVTLIGHSFGGGVALQTAHDHPHLVCRLVLVNAVGGSEWKTGRALRDRPLWDWGLHLGTNVLSPRRVSRVLPVVLEDAIGNALRNPKGVWHVGRLARDANLEEQLATVRRRRLPVFILWGKEDRVIPLASVEALARDAEVHTVPGDHNWLITDPDRFAEVMTNVVGDIGLGGTAATEEPAVGL
ncbi:MAG TPA: alpha/beta fold hydrolase [Nocardioides sp.]|nr:alpha/beta fold hydrolase [Nocardioides sp.]